MYSKICRGFTLVELIATIVIVALIAIVSGPLFFSASVFKQSGFYEETLSAVRYAQKHAVATGCGVRVQITANTFTLFSDNDFDPTNPASCNDFTTVLADPTGQPGGFTRTAPQGVTLNPTRDFRFAPDGTTNLVATTISVNVGNRQFLVHRDTGFVERR